MLPTSLSPFSFCISLPFENLLAPTEQSPFLIFFQTSVASYYRLPCGPGWWPPMPGHICKIICKRRKVALRFFILAHMPKSVFDVTLPVVQFNLFWVRVDERNVLLGYLLAASRRKSRRQTERSYLQLGHPVAQADRRANPGRAIIQAGLQGSSRQAIGHNLSTALQAGEHRARLSSAQVGDGHNHTHTAQMYMLCDLHTDKKVTLSRPTETGS